MANQLRMLSYERQWVKMVAHPKAVLDSQLLGNLRISHFFLLPDQKRLETKIEDQTQSKERLLTVLLRQAHERRQYPLFPKADISNRRAYDLVAATSDVHTRHSVLQRTAIRCRSPASHEGQECSNSEQPVYTNNTVTSVPVLFLKPAYKGNLI